MDGRCDNDLRRNQDPWEGVGDSGLDICTAQHNMKGTSLVFIQLVRSSHTIDRRTTIRSGTSAGPGELFTGSSPENWPTGAKNRWGGCHHSLYDSTKLPAHTFLFRQRISLLITGCCPCSNCG
ncbi:hypothetical protein VTI74DRAFT_11388 [Chaetomium olivicolor]